MNIKMAAKNVLTTAEYLTFDDFMLFLNNLRKDEEYVIELFARVAFCTACRASDVLSLTWEQVLGKNTVLITEIKTGKTRSINFNGSVQKKLHELYKLMECPDVSLPMFCNRYTKKAITIQHINRELKRLKRKYKMKIRNFSTHTFRKTFGRYVYEHNNRSAESLILLNTIFKHSSINITKRYIGITQDEVNKIFDSIQF